jgi:hypothetical protein
MKSFGLIVLVVALLASHLLLFAHGKYSGRKNSGSFGKKLKTAAVIGGTAFVGYKAGKFASKLGSMNLGNVLGCA